MSIFFFYNFSISFFFFFNATATTEIYTLSLHDALPIFLLRRVRITTLQEWFSPARVQQREDRKSTRLNSSHVSISYAVFCLKKKKWPSNWDNVLTSICFRCTILCGGGKTAAFGFRCLYFRGMCLFFF